MTHRRERLERRRAAGPQRSRAFAESSAILALFALCLNLFAAFLPPPALAAFSGSDTALICSSGAADDDGTPPAPSRPHHCQDCLAQQTGGSANLPEPAPALLKLPAAAPLLAALDQIAVSASASAKAQPRAPPALS